MGDALAVMLPTLRKTVRGRIGEDAFVIGAACDEFVAGICRVWPQEAMTTMARKGPEIHPLDEAVLVAKCREDVEAMWGDSEVVQSAFASIGPRVVKEFAALWFESADNRAIIRQCCRESRRSA